MKLNKIWGYGQLFGYSAIDGPNRYYEDCILMTMKKKLCFRYEFNKFIKLYFDTKEKIKFEAVMSDFVIAKIGDKDFKFAFLDNDTLCGISPVLPSFKGERKLTVSKSWGVDIYSLENHYLGVRFEKDKDCYKFVIHHSLRLTEARSGANYLINDFDIDEIITEKINYYKNMPKCLDKKYESLYYKALSINKVNVHSPEGKIQYMWTTPDRVPHKNMWLWDSAFHALAMVQYNHRLAEECLLAMLSQMRSNGFLSHMANPTDCSDVTQPCVLSWASLNVYKVTKNKKFLSDVVNYLDKYLTYDMNNRDNNHNGLLEWFTEPEYASCKCGESGLDNSPRFDFDEEMDAFDFSTYFALDTNALSEIYLELGNVEKSKYWKDVSLKTSKLINELMYSKEDGAYFDRLYSGKLTYVLTHSSFLPLFAGIAPKENAPKMVERMFNKDELFTKMPLASISQKDPRYSTDMWRGGAWLNINYFCIVGLLKYGYKKEAKLLRDITLEKVNKWYKKTGTIFEFYDSKDEVSPFYCYRKGEPRKTPDYRKHVHSISDYNWSACFTLLLIQNKFYL